MFVFDLLVLNKLMGIKLLKVGMNKKKLVVRFIGNLVKNMAILGKLSYSVA